MLSVKACPTNQFDVDSASLRRNCSKDEYENNQYMCIPNTEKTSLVEFCFEGNLKLADEGNCIEVSKDKIIQHNCSHFTFGCPNASFHYAEIHKYPACQNINTEAQCYVSDPSCPTQASTDNLGNYNFTSTVTYLPKTTTEEISHAAQGETDSHIALCYILVLVVLIAVIAFTCFWKRKKEKDKLKRREGDRSAPEQHLLEDGNYPGESKEGDSSAPEQHLLEDGNYPGESKEGDSSAPGQHLLEDGNYPGESKEGDSSAPGQRLLKNGDNPGESKEGDSSAPGQHLLEDGKYPGESKEGDNSAPDNSNSVTESKVKSEEEYKTAQEVISGPIDNSNSETEFKVKSEEEYKTAQETAKNKYIGKICKTIIKEIENKDNTDRRSNVQETVDEEHMQVHFVHVKGVPDRDANDTGVSDRGISDTGVPDRDANDTVSGDSDRGISNTGGADGNNTETVDTSGNVCKVSATGQRNTAKASAKGRNNVVTVSAKGKNNVVTAMAVGDNNIAIATAEGEDNVSEARAEGTRNEAVGL